MKTKTVAILESRLGGQLAELVSKQGRRSLLAPALAEVPDVDGAFIAGLVNELQSSPAKMAIFQTGVGVRALFSATDSLGLSGNMIRLLEKSVVVVRGPEPAAALRARGVRIDLSAKEPFTTAEVLESLQAVPIQDERVIVQGYDKTNVELETALRARGARVIEIPTYRWVLPEDTGPLVKLIDALERSKVDVTVFTSASQIHNLFALADKLGRKDSLAANLNRTLVASIGPVCTAALKELGVGVALEATPPKLGPLVSALDQALSR
ncbi:MAG: uroporphyrinogen-III synthase [Burkholderiales bacterium]